MWRCSVYDGAVYVVRSDRTGYRRITNAPTCAELASLPKGSVTVQVMDLFGTSFVYVAGAPGLTRARTGAMTLDNVADFGSGVLQPAIGIAVLERVMGGPPTRTACLGQGLSASLADGHVNRGGHAHANIDAHAYGDCLLDADSHADADCFCYAFANADAHPNRHDGTDGDIHPYRDTDVYRRPQRRIRQRRLLRLRVHERRLRPAGTPGCR
jgi:hypothetical protein